MQWGYAGLFNAGVMALSLRDHEILVTTRTSWRRGDGLLAPHLLGRAIWVDFPVGGCALSMWRPSSLLGVLAHIFRVFDPPWRGGGAEHRLVRTSAARFGSAGMASILFGVLVCLRAGLSAAWRRAAWQIIGKITLGSNRLLCDCHPWHCRNRCCPPNEQWLTRGVKNVDELGFIAACSPPAKIKTLNGEIVCGCR